jgi:hypothetical protein
MSRARRLVAYPLPPKHFRHEKFRGIRKYFHSMA